jgi:hypothetical protein
MIKKNLTVKNIVWGMRSLSMIKSVIPQTLAFELFSFFPNFDSQTAEPTAIN